MISTLKERIRERLDVTGMSNAQLAKACNVAEPTSYHWASGKTKQIKGEPLLLAAKALGVTPEWLSSGLGKKYPPSETATNVVKENFQPFGDHDAWTLEAIRILTKLDEPSRRAAVILLRTFAIQANPPGYGQALSVAENKRASNGI